MMKRTGLTIAVGLLAAASAGAADMAQERHEIRRVCGESLDMLKKHNPAAAAEVDRAVGYGCFANLGMVVIVGGAGGKGLVHDNASGRDYYMDQAQVSAGPDIEVKKYREILVFSRHDVLDQFVHSGWSFTGSGSATAKVEGEGGDVEGVAGNEAIHVYPMTSTGLALGGVVGARKYWLDKELNEPKA